MNHTEIICDICGKDPGSDPINPVIWFGFHDADTAQDICAACKNTHYRKKNATKLGGMYSEIPVVISTRQIQKQLKIKKPKS